MATPALTFTGEALYEALAPLAAEDEDHGYALAHYSGAQATMLDQVADWSRDQDDGTPGWAILMDPDRCPPEALDWLAQFVGVRFPFAMDPATKRARIKSTDGFKRGTPAAVRAAAQQFLTGSKTVYMTERWGGNAYAVRIATLASETPNPTLVTAALMDQKPGGILLTYQTVTGQDFNALRDTHTDFADVTATFVTFNEIRDNPTKQ